MKNDKLHRLSAVNEHPGGDNPAGISIGERPRDAGLTAPSHTPQAAAERLARDFLERVWGGTPDLDAIDQLMSEDYELLSAGDSIRGRAAFKQWVADFQQRLTGARNEVADVFAAAAGDRVAARWTCSGRSAGVFGLPADGRRLHFSGLSIWAVRDGRLSRCWVERSSPRVDD